MPCPPPPAHLPPHHPPLPAPALAADLPNLALKKTATASASEDANPPGNAVDGDPPTRWCTDSDATGAWWKIDLEKPQSLAGCQLLWEHDTATYKFIIEGSLDNKTWITLNDQRAATETKSPQKLALAATPVRYVRITITGLDDGSWASFFELQLFAADAMKSLTPEESKTYLPSAPSPPPPPPPNQRTRNVGAGMTTNPSRGTPLDHHTRQTHQNSPNPPEKRVASSQRDACVSRPTRRAQRPHLLTTRGASRTTAPPAPTAPKTPAPAPKSHPPSRPRHSGS